MLFASVYKILSYKHNFQKFKLINNLCYFWAKKDNEHNFVKLKLKRYKINKFVKSFFYKKNPFLQLQKGIFKILKTELILSLI